MGAYRNKEIFEDKDFQYIVEVDFQLSSFIEYINLTESTIEKEIKDKIGKYNLFLKKESDEEIEMYDSADHEIKLQVHQLYYNSIFISLYSFLERKMFQLCRLSEAKQSIKIKDLSGDGIVKYYKYFKKVLLLDLEKLNSEWTVIKKYNKLRNCLVHFSSNILEKKENNSDQIQILKSIDNLVVIDKGDYFEFEISDKKLLLNFCSIIATFLHAIYYERG